MAPVSQDEDLGSALALAVISVSSAPLLLMDEAFDIVAASQSFLIEFRLDRGDGGRDAVGPVRAYGGGDRGRGAGADIAARGEAGGLARSRHFRCSVAPPHARVG